MVEMFEKSHGKFFRRVCASRYSAAICNDILGIIYEPYHYEEKDFRIAWGWLHDFLMDRRFEQEDEEFVEGEAGEKVKDFLDEVERMKREEI